MPDLAPDAVLALAPASLYSLEGKTAVVTGAAGGIGRWLAAGLGAAGAGLLLTDANEEGLGEVAAILARAGVHAEALAIDLGDDGAPDRIVSGAAERLGRLDILVNCAAVNRRMPILEMDRKTYEWIMGIDLRVPYFLSQAAARAMIEQGGGSIVNISSLNERIGLEGNSVYGPAKAGVSQLTKVMAAEWTHLGVRANAIAPGFVDTPLAVAVWENPVQQHWILNRVPAKRLARPDELVGLCLLLASDAGSFITGQTIYVDGGFLAAGRWFTPDE
ncbi:MAG: SDR family oxidoreductase [Thermoleophilia bacterium]|nr:SDR family oxidoreductase [Thermoleophilia bacterium]